MEKQPCSQLQYHLGLYGKGIVKVICWINGMYVNQPTRWETTLGSARYMLSIWRVS